MKKQAFTLAEILLSISIIGVIAALTIPNLMLTSSVLKYQTGFKKAITTLSEVAQTSNANHQYDFAGVEADINNNCIDDKPDNYTMCGLLNGTLSGHKWVAINETPEDIYENIITKTILSGSPYNYVILADGTLIAFNNNFAECTLGIGENVKELIGNGYDKCLGFIDVNGFAPPNKEVTCSSGETYLLNKEADEDGNNGYTECKVDKKKSDDFTDIYPVIFHDSIVVPATNAAIAVYDK